MNQRTAICLLLCALLVLQLFSGCGSRSEPPAAEPEPILPETAEPEPDYNRLVHVSDPDARNAILGDRTLELAAQLPEARWNSLPQWNGVTIPNLQEYGIAYDGQPQAFCWDDLGDIAGLGFNFVRVPLDTRYFFDPENPEQVHLDKLKNLDDLIGWSAKFGIHVCLDVHSTLGFTTDGDDTNDTFWETPAEQDLFLTFWDMLAERYRDVSGNLLSFDLLNEPSWFVTEESYAVLMRRAIAQIRTHSPNRLIFVDMLNGAKEPVYSLAADQVAQSFHFYEPNALTHTGIHDDFGGAYPVMTGKGMITGGTDGFLMEGNFPAGTEIQFQVDEFHMGGTLHLEADGSEVFSHVYAMDAVGENNCTYIREEGTGGEYRGYSGVLQAVLPADASVLRLYTTGDSRWFNLSRLLIRAGDNRYLFEQNLDPYPEGIGLEEMPNPHIVIAEDGTVTDSGDVMFGVVDAAYLHDKLAAYRAFSEETGVAVMMQEFGVYYAADYGLTLTYLNDLLDAANANGLNWCGWDYFGPFSFYSVAEDRVREGAAYEPFSNGQIATEMLAVYQSHLTQ